MDRLNFSQRNGLEPMPSPLGIGELPDQARNLIWNCLYKVLLSVSYNTRRHSFLEDPWERIAKDIHISFFQRPVDEFDPHFHTQSSLFKETILSGSYGKVFDFMERIIAYKPCPLSLIKEWASIFESQGLAYRLLPDEKIIVPRASEEEDRAINAALESSRDRYKGAYEHLKTSLTFLRDNDPRQSIRESINAIESLVRVLTVQSTFREAMKTLAPSMNPNMKRGFEALYDYTSDEKGIRHPLLEETSNVTFDDAQFMLSACAAFISYVINRQDTLPSP